MSEFRRNTQVTGLVASALFLLLALAQSCARSEPLQPSDAVVTVKQQLPFHSETEQGSSNEGAQPSALSNSKVSPGLPFRTALHPRLVPSGTLLTVDLQSSLTTARGHIGDMFKATVAAPLSIDGDTLIQSGTQVVGRIESARSRPGQPGSGYFRLTLTAISVDGKSIPLQTSSLFARGSVRQSHPSSSASNSTSNALRVQKGRALTFRLIAPVALGDSTAIANPEYADRGTK